MLNLDVAVGVQQHWKTFVCGIAMPEVRAYLDAFMIHNLTEDEARMTPRAAVEAIYCNMRDDKPAEYFSGSLLAFIPLEGLSVLFDRAAEEMDGHDE